MSYEFCGGGVDGLVQTLIFIDSIVWTRCAVGEQCKFLKNTINNCGFNKCSLKHLFFKKTPSALCYTPVLFQFPPIDSNHIAKTLYCLERNKSKLVVGKNGILRDDNSATVLLVIWWIGWLPFWLPIQAMDSIVLSLNWNKTFPGSIQCNSTVLVGRRVLSWKAAKNEDGW